MQGIVNGVAQRRDKVWLRDQRHALLDQKLSLMEVLAAAFTIATEIHMREETA